MTVMKEHLRKIQQLHTVLLLLGYRRDNTVVVKCGSLHTLENTWFYMSSKYC